ncbi:MAG: Fe-Mn family superoxide dismutase [Candidatus Micrarchaeota archaeon]
MRENRDAQHAAKPLKYKSLDGLSERQLSEHHGVLYAGYVKKLNEIDPALRKADKSAANATYSEIGELKRQEVFATNAISLHESYFDNLGGKGGAPQGDIAKLLTEDYGSVEEWQADFIAAGVASRGWVVLAFNWDDMRLHNYSADYHSQGVWNCTAILVLDVYEHAYFVDYATARKNYIEAFLKNVDWDFVNAKVARLGVMRARERKV